MMTLMESVAGAVESNASDCGQMAAAVEKVVNDNQAALAEMRAASGGSTNDALFDDWMAKNEGRAQAVRGRIGPGLEKCSGESRLQDAFMKLDL